MPRPRSQSAVFLAAALVLGVTAGAVASRLGGSTHLRLAVVAALGAVLFHRQVGAFALVALAILAPLFNPPVAGSFEDGRVYLTAVFIGAAIAAGFGTLLLTRGPWPRYAVTTALIVLAYAVIMYRPDAEGVLPWLYRPLQPVIVALATIAITQTRPALAAKLLRIALGAGGLGIALGVAHAVYQPFDPFAFTRPADLPFESRVLFYERATGGFVYPNVFGLFCAYMVVAAIGARSSRWIGPTASGLLILLGTAGAVTSASRAAIGALLLGVVYVIYASERSLRLQRLLVGSALGMGGWLLVAGSASGAAVLEDRLADTIGRSLLFRQAAANTGWANFVKHPYFGTGVEQSRLDNGLLLYLSMGGLFGFALLCLAIYSVASPWDVNSRIPVASRALLVVLASSSLLQDSLGQTLSTQFLGLMLGLFATLDRSRAEAQTSAHVAFRREVLSHRIQCPAEPPSSADRTQHRR